MFPCPFPEGLLCLLELAQVCAPGCWPDLLVIYVQLISPGICLLTYNMGWASAQAFHNFFFIIFQFAVIDSSVVGGAQSVAHIIQSHLGATSLGLSIAETLQCKGARG